MESLSNKVTLISGAGHGFGRRVAVLFAENKAKVVLADINLEGAEETAKECRKAGISEADILCVKADITKEEDRSNLIKQTIDKFSRLDILINNAGLARFVTMEDTTEEVYDLTMNLNVKAHFFLTKLAVPYLKESKGCIVNISSIVGQEVLVRGIAYSMSKVAVDSFTRSVALDLAESGVRVNSVRPGVVHTGLYDVDFGAQVPMVMEMVKNEHPLGRLGTVDDIANAVAFLASDKASFITGQHLAVDGGRLCVGASYRGRQEKKETIRKIEAQGK